MPEKEVADTISDATLESEQFLVVHVGDSFTSKGTNGDRVRTKDSELWFFQVGQAVELNREDIKLHDTNGNTVGPISANSGVDYQRLHDDNGDDLLRNDDNQFRAYHVSLGVRQPEVRVYPRIPENENGGGWTYLSGSEPDPTQGDNFGFVSGYETDFEDPSTKLETMVWYEGVQTEHQWGFFNTDPQRDVDPILSLRGRGYELRPVTEEDAMLNLLADVGRFEENRDNAVKLVEYSNSALDSFTFEIPEDWKSVENTLSISEANLPEEIEEFIDESGGNPNQKAGGGNGGNN